MPVNPSAIEVIFNSSWRAGAATLEIDLSYERQLRIDVYVVMSLLAAPKANQNLIVIL